MTAYKRIKAAGCRAGNPYPYVAAAVIWGSAFCVSCRFGSMPLEAPSEATGRSVAAALLGGSRAALSGHFSEMADLYFHRGVGHKRVRAFQGSFFQKLSEEISPTSHTHVHGRAANEIMPWLWFAIRTDPRNVEIYLVAAYWLARGGRADLAHEVLQEAQWNNLFNYEIQLQNGRIYLEEQRPLEAKRSFDAGLAFWPGGEKPDSEQARYDKRSLLLYRALLHEMDGENDAAIQKLRQVLVIFPEMSRLHGRIHKLQQGDQPSLLPSQYLKDMLKKDDREKATCERL